MNHVLRRYYYKILIPALLLLFAAEGYKAILMSGDQIQSLNFRPLSITIFILCAATAFGLPLLYRSYYAHIYKNIQSISAVVFLKFQKRLLLLALSAVYISVIGFTISLPDFYKYGVVLFALYAAYYYYPSDRRLNLDKRIYRCQDLQQETFIKEEATEGTEMGKD